MDRHKEALRIALNSYRELWKDIAEGKVELDQLKDKHELLFDATEEQISRFLELPSPEIVIDICDGEIQEVYSQEPIKYAVYNPDLEFDPYDVKEAKGFKDYAEVIGDLDASYQPLDT